MTMVQKIGNKTKGRKEKRKERESNNTKTLDN